MSNIYTNKVVFAVGTGRCGTKFISELLSLEKVVGSSHERDPLNETFHRYCKWNNLPVDDSGFINCKKNEIDSDLTTKNISFEASAHLAFSILNLFEEFECKFILFVRSPEKMIESYAKKGVYANSIIRADHNKAIGNQGLEKFHQFLGRIVPNSFTEFEQWNQLSQYGKLAWWWKVVNSSIINQLNQIPKEKWMIQKIEEFDYDNYLNLCEFIKIDATIKEKKFLKLSNSRPNSFKQIKRRNYWTEHDLMALKKLNPLAEEFGYDISSLSLDKLNM